MKNLLSKRMKSFDLRVKLASVFAIIRKTVVISKNIEKIKLKIPTLLRGKIFEK